MGRPKSDPVERFWNKVNKNGPFPDFSDPLIRVSEFDGNCWSWTGKIGRGGYARFYLDGHETGAHRFSLKLVGIDLLSQEVPDHLCRNHGCVRPNHLQPVSTRENILRGAALAACNAVKTHCMRGHEFDAVNTRHYVNAWGNPARGCRKCAAILSMERRSKKRMEKI